MKENLTIYLISGKARHGKTTSANMIKDYYNSIGKKSLVTSYGKYIKMYVQEITDWDGNPDTKPRDLLQSLGTGVIREKLGKQDFYVKRLDEDMDVYNEYVEAVMIDDVRLPIEMDYFLERYPSRIKTIHIVRPNFENDLTAEQRAHVTEKGLDNYEKYDYTIMNDGSLSDLREKIYSLIEGIEKK